MAFFTTEGDAEILIQGSTSAIQAEIWCFPEPQDVTFTASPYLEGPFSSRGKTLTTKFEFVRSKLGDQAAWKATILEPVLWTPRMPAVYRLGGFPGISSTIGLRDLRIKGDSFYWEDRRWVARATSVHQPETLLENESSHRERLISIVPPHGSAFLAQADEVGSALIIDATRVEKNDLASEISRLSAHASVTMILLPSDCDEDNREAAHSHVQLGTFLKESQQAPGWADFIAVSESQLSSGWSPDRRLPIVATRECDIENCSPAELRAMCDQFQADLDHGADYAGLWLLPKASS